MSEVILNREEFLALADAAAAQAVAGVARADLFPDDRAALIRSGVASLQQRNLLSVGEDGVLLLHPVLAAMVIAITHPEIVIVSARDTPGRGRQLFLLYQAGELAVEQTFPAERMHRLAGPLSIPAIFERIQQIFPLRDGGLPPFASEMDQATLLRLKDFAESHGDQTADQVRRQLSLASPELDGLITAVQHPEFGGTVTFLRPAEAEVVDGRDLAVVQNGAAAWLMYQKTPGHPLLEVERAGQARFSELLHQYFAALRT